MRPFAGSLATVAVFALSSGPIAAVADPCVVPNNGGGTVNLPPAGCGYVSPDDLHMMIDGLPVGTTITVAAEHMKFFNVTTNPGGSLGGEVEHFQSILQLQMQGTGALAGFNRFVAMSPQCETHTAPRTPGDPVQSFDTDMFLLQGQITGDPDFDLLRITAGTGFGMPSPGHTTLTRLPSGNYNVDSFFDITYRIDFVGAPGSVLGGMSGSTTGTIRMQSGQPVTPLDPCTVAPDPTGVVHLPPQGCGYVSPTDLHMMIDGLPAGTTIQVDAKHNRFFNTSETPGGSLGGAVETFSSFLEMTLQGTGDLPGFSRSVQMPVQCQTHTGPRDPSAPFQTFDTEMFMMQGQLPPGDPDFDLLRITGGTGFGLPSPGHTTLARLPGGNYAVDSFFDITYRIDFVGHPGGALGGMSGSTTGTIRMRTGDGSTTDSELLPPPKATKLLQNVPNPFNPSTKISFEIGTAGKVKLLIVDASGRVVRNLVDSNMMPNRYTLLWDGLDDRGRKAASGTYFYTLIAPDFQESRSMVLLK